MLKLFRRLTQFCFYNISNLAKSSFWQRVGENQLLKWKRKGESDFLFFSTLNFTKTNAYHVIFLTIQMWTVQKGFFSKLADCAIFLSTKQSEGIKRFQKWKLFLFYPIKRGDEDKVKPSHHIPKKCVYGWISMCSFSVWTQVWVFVNNLWLFC